MDLNYLYYRHGASLMSAETATSSCARIVHEKLANAYAKAIADACPVGKRQRYWTRWEAYLTYPCIERATVHAKLTSPGSAEGAISATRI